MHDADSTTNGTARGPAERPEGSTSGSTGSGDQADGASAASDEGAPIEPGIERMREVAVGLWHDPWFTVPNLLSAIRLGGVPLFLWLLLGPQADLLALLVLIASGITDWLDGKLARWLGQYSRLGEVLDPVADRLYIVATLVAFVLRDIIPWWIAAVLVGRDVVLALCVPVLRFCGFQPPDVHYLGKAATFCLMYAFPMLLLVQEDFAASEVLRPIAYALTCWGGVLYLWAGVLYLGQVVAAVRQAARAVRR